LVQQDGTAIDMPAGPSEVCVLADNTADPAFIAADLLAQAEHGIDSQVMLVSTVESLVDAVLKQIEIQLDNLPRKSIAQKALENSKALVFDDLDVAMDFVNIYAPEHLIIACKSASTLVDKIINAGSVFLGNFTPESVGDYASGTNHTLPTNGFARAYSGVSVDSFVKKITFQELSPEGLRLIAPTVTNMARAEGLEAHARAVEVRE
jgi:histidinol dehydrogenase